MTEYTHAGCVVVREDGEKRRFLVITASGNRKHWVFPKGHIEKGDKPDETARREVSEEAGVEATVLKPIGSIRFSRKHEEVFARYYLMKFVAEHGAAEDREKRWLTYDEALDVLTFAGSREMLRLAYARLPAAGGPPGSH